MDFQRQEFASLHGMSGLDESGGYPDPDLFDDCDFDDCFPVEEEDDLVAPPSTAPPGPRAAPRHGPNKIRKGSGRDSKNKSPDKWDEWKYELNSYAFLCLRQMGYEGIILGALYRVLEMVERDAKLAGIRGRLTPRNRAAHRRKPCAFHWLDENWFWIGESYKAAVRCVLGETSGVKPRGRRRKPRTEPESLLH
jgi:hypothetical protein